MVIPNAAKGDFNRWIRKGRELLRNIRKKIATLTDWITAIKNELNRPQTPDLATLLIACYDARNAGAWSRTSRINNLKDFSATVNYLTENNISSLEELQARG